MQTSSSKNLKARGVLFGLKPGKAMTYYCYAKGVGKVKHTATVSKPKFTSNKSGYKTATFTITHRLKGNITKKQQKAFLQAIQKYGSIDNFFGWNWNHFLDYNTGVGIECANNGVDAEWKKLSNVINPTKTYRDSDGTWFYLAKMWKAEYAITYPEDYKGLCIGIGGDTVPYNSRTAADRKHSAAKKISYFKTSYYKKGLKNNHFMKIS